ncbi:mannose-1-phosphate guanylyltransferase/mannose-6-phosphate isomerase [Pseudoponticoccus marisrubri]|uniref:mannose-1-phosphate guanylyltransferase n=1 Tax=Pseudoponticoccus marisrubri TaxID=1685382 RepID=A0A0W7WEQ3_9RHOB|nr:mannose-1-phosphate guanylyltransferase/mannose-6-phosphate isomerase [Pseudoponticoccus marisrubri]KUF08958.1 mannose-1-phosphate guanyltransferase [Pseudoponticoccus marisrubri]
MITPILLCGGSGTRLWPLSRKSYPKQFAPLVGTETLFQASARRVTGEGFAPPRVLTHVDFRFIVTEQLAAIGIAPAAVLLEPEGRNTAPAIAAAALELAESDPDGLMLVTPSDHAIPDQTAFRSAVTAGIEAARDGCLVTFGVRPDRAETGYGYLELSGQPGAIDAPGPQPVAGFVEKPDPTRAADMLRGGTHLWNAGIFLFSVATILAAFERHAPAILDAARSAIAQGRPDLGFFRLDSDAWGAAESISIDYAIMERADAIVAVPFAGAWSDLGSWNAVWRDGAQDTDGVVTSGPATALDCTDTLLRSEEERLELVGIGLKDVVAIAMPDAVLVADAGRTQEVRMALDVLKAKGAPQAETFPKDHRPWGWFETLARGPRFQVKRIVVHPGAALSLQSHHHRSEHWIVVEGTARVTVGDAVKLVSENESIYVPLGAHHRLENPGKLPMVLIEVQTGSYLGEDDIIRYEDVYARG